MIENKISETQSQEKLLKRIQAKIMAIFASLCINSEKENGGENEIATFFKKSIMLIGQVFNSVTYHWRLNILSTLTGNIYEVQRYH